MSAEQAAARWADELAAWAIPEEILDSVPDSPWYFPPSLFRAHDPGERDDTPSLSKAREALPHGGRVLDVGAGGGAASLPLAPQAGLIVAVDESESMLSAFAARANDLGVEHEEITGRWPDVARSAPVADVVVCAHVFYNVADLAAFAQALTDHARVRVVVELTDVHPLVNQNRLWRHFHPGVSRPQGPTADDAVAVLAEAGIDVHFERFQRAPLHRGSRAHWVSFARRRLCVPAEREPEVDALLADPEDLLPGEAVTLWWEGRAEDQDR